MAKVKCLVCGSEEIKIHFSTVEHIEGGMKHKLTGVCSDECYKKLMEKTTSYK